MKKYRVRGVASISIDAYIKADSPEEAVAFARKARAASQVMWRVGNQEDLQIEPNRMDVHSESLEAVRDASAHRYFRTDGDFDFDD